MLCEFRYELNVQQFIADAHALGVLMYSAVVEGDSGR
jgi:hypothetical protein